MAEVINGISWAAITRELDKLHVNEKSQVTDYLRRCFHMENNMNKRVEERSVSAMGDAEAWPGDANGQGLPIIDMGDRFSIQATNQWYGAKTRISKDLRQHDKFALMKKKAAMLPRSVYRKKQKMGIGYLSAGFTTVWNTGEGKYLFATDHPLDYKIAIPGTVGCNLVTGGVTPATYSEMLYYMWMTPDDGGNYMELTADIWLVHPHKWARAIEIQGKPAWKPDTANNTPNGVAEAWGIPTIIPCPLIPDEDMTFMFNSREHGNVFNTVVDFEQWNWRDADSQMEYRAAAFEAVIFSRDWRGSVGSYQ